MTHEVSLLWVALVFSSKIAAAEIGNDSVNGFTAEYAKGFAYTVQRNFRYIPCHALHPLQSVNTFFSFHVTV